MNVQRATRVVLRQVEYRQVPKYTPKQAHTIIQSLDTCIAVGLALGTSSALRCFLVPRVCTDLSAPPFFQPHWNPSPTQGLEFLGFEKGGKGTVGRNDPCLKFSLGTKLPVPGCAGQNENLYRSHRTNFHMCASSPTGFRHEIGRAHV